MTAKTDGAAKLAELLAGRARPSGGMCLACLHKHSDCSGLPFSGMPVMKREKDGSSVVRCTGFLHQPVDAIAEAKP